MQIFVRLAPKKSALPSTYLVDIIHNRMVIDPAVHIKASRCAGGAMTEKVPAAL